jgi:hypothetical protein
MKLIPVFIAVVAVSFSGCQSGSAFQYSETIVKIERSLAPDINDARERISASIDAGKNDSLVIIAAHMEALVGAKLQEVQNLEMPHVKEAENFKRAVVRYFTFMRETYTAYKKYGEQTTDEGREKVHQNLVEIIREAKKAVDEMKAAQQKFADANHFKIETK